MTSDCWSRDEWFHAHCIPCTTKELMLRDDRICCDQLKYAETTCAGARGRSVYQYRRINIDFKTKIFAPYCPKMLIVAIISVYMKHYDSMRQHIREFPIFPKHFRFCVCPSYLLEVPFTTNIWFNAISLTSSTSSSSSIAYVRRACCVDNESSSIWKSGLTTNTRTQKHSVGQKNFSYFEYSRHFQDSVGPVVVSQPHIDRTMYKYKHKCGQYS